MSENPYQAPALSAGPLMAESSVRVDGRFLVVRSGAVLPPRCVKTNRPVSPGEFVRRYYTWCSPVYAVLILVSGLLLVLIYFLVRKRCEINFGLSSEVRRKYRKRLLVKAMVATFSFLALPVSAGTDSTAVIAAVFVLFIASFISLFLGNSPLAVSKYRRGEFWIAGCSRDYLAQLEAVPADVYPPVAP